MYYQQQFQDIIFISVKLKQMIRRGLHIDDDSDTQIKEERVTLDANRKRDKFERDMDDFLFGGPPKRKSVQKKVQVQKKTQKSQIINQQLTVIKIQQSQVRKVQSNSIINKQQLIKKPQPPKQPQKQKSFSNSPSKIKPSQTIQISQNNSRVSTVKLNQSTISAQKSNITQTKTLGQKQKSLIFKDVQNSRPNYIRKLRYASQMYGFGPQNQTKHNFIDVVRPLECFKSHFNKKSVMNFKDKQFPPIPSSLGYHLRNYNVVWKKCQQFFKHPTLGKYIDPNDIRKGTFSSCKYLSTLSVLAQRQQNIKRIIEQQFLNPNGAYYVRLFINSIWRYQVVDSYIPLEDQKNGGSINYNDSQSDLWVPLIQKAYAKVFNGYDVFTRPQPREYYFRDLTGAPTSNHMIDNPQILNLIKRALQNKKVVAAVLKSSASDLGLNTNFTLTVLNTNKKGGLTLRYSWPLIQQKSGIPISKQAQLAQYISYVTIIHLNRSYFTTTIQNPYKIVIKENTTGFFTISQFDQRMFPRQSYEYEPTRLWIQKKKTDDNSYEYIKGGFSHMSRNLDIQVQLTPGEYQLFAFINWKKHVYDFNITFYGDKKINFEKILTLKNHNIISQGLQTYNLQYGKRSALGHCHQFIIYHQQTNQILITVSNTSAKSYTYSQDMRKINFQSLHLMNLTNNQDNALQYLTKEQLQNYKQNAFQNRKWDVQFKGGQIFTWVISTSENYDVNNFRNWGFR